MTSDENDRSARTLIKAEEAGDIRYFLDGQPVHCGDRLELRLPGDHWVSVSFEMSDRHALLCMPVGGDWEAWRPPAGKQEGDDIEVRCATCAGTGRRHEGETCEGCDGKGVMVGLSIDDPERVLPCASKCRDGRVAAERSCTFCDGRGTYASLVERPSPPRLVLRGELDKTELRWPNASRGKR